MFRYLDMQDELVRKRVIITNAEHRFFFALLLNLDDREHILELVRQRYPDSDAVEKILDWVFDLAQTRVLGKEGNALGVEVGEPEMLALEGILRGKTDDDLMAEFAAAAPQASAEEIREALSRIRSSVVFRPLVA